MENIDIVLTWVDNNDPNWLKQKNKFQVTDNENKANRFRDWGTLIYIFRGIEKFMPWVHKIYFVTWGHLPDWLNRENEKLVIVNHEDYIPAKYLPTFNSNVLDLNMFRIKGLSEQYINFNDDTFVIKQTKPEDFFVNGLPKDLACISPQPIRRDSIMNIELNNLKILNSYFSTKDIKKNYSKWLNVFKYGTLALRTVLFMNFNTIIGIYEPHIPISHLKSIAEELWEKEYEAYDLTCKNKFRTIADINDWLFRQWQLMSGKFEPRSRYFGIFVRITENELIHKVLKKSRFKMICINDNLQDENIFEQQKCFITKELNALLPEKSSFEL